jgi:hypothetical protein
MGFLVGLTGLNVRKAFAVLRQTQNLYSPVVPAATVVLAGLAHAAFEDWMFAVGNYVCVFFWSLAFILVDCLKEQTTTHSVESTQAYELQWLAAAAGQ